MISENRIIRSMVGRELTDRFPREHHIGEPMLEVKNWTVHHPSDRDRVIIDDVSVTLNRGEVVGIAGLMGAGRTEFAMSVFGRAYGSRISGEIYKNGSQIKVRTVGDAIRHKIAYVSEDRKKFGIIQLLNIKENITLANLN